MKVSTAALQATAAQATASSTPTKPGYVWCTDHWRRARADGLDPCVTQPSGVTVTHTPATDEMKKCAGGTVRGKSYPPYRGDDYKKCRAWVAAGHDYADFKHVLFCQNKGYAGDALAVCIAGRKQGKTYAEIDQAIAALEQQAIAAAEQQAAAEAAVAGRKRTNLLIYGGIGAAAIVLFLILKKKRSK
jgi:hypothetical protein